MISLDVGGIPAVRDALTRLANGAEALSGVLAVGGSDLRYAYGIEYGRHKGGRLARRAGGAHMLQEGIDALAPTAGARLAASLPLGRAATIRAAEGIMDNIISAAQPFTPVRSGDLLRSLHTVRGAGR